MKDYDEVLKKLLDCWSKKKELDFFEILANLTDSDIDELLSTYVNIPDEMKILISDYKKERSHLKNLK